VRAGEGVQGGVTVVVPDHDEVFGSAGQVQQRLADGRVAQHVGVHGQDTAGALFLVGCLVGGQDGTGNGGLQLGDERADFGVHHGGFHDRQRLSGGGGESGARGDEYLPAAAALVVLDAASAVLHDRRDGLRDQGVLQNAGLQHGSPRRRLAGLLVRAVSCTPDLSWSGGSRGVLLPVCGFPGSPVGRENGWRAAGRGAVAARLCLRARVRPRSGTPEGVQEVSRPRDGTDPVTAGWRRRSRA
jgi:hypothetical protein